MNRFKIVQQYVLKPTHCHGHSSWTWHEVFTCLPVIQCYLMACVVYFFTYYLSLELTGWLYTFWYINLYRILCRIIVFNVESQFPSSNHTGEKMQYNETQTGLTYDTEKIKLRKIYLNTKLCLQMRQPLWSRQRRNLKRWGGTRHSWDLRQHTRWSSPVTSVTHSHSQFLTWR